jgi:hypothetical protein
MPPIDPALVQRITEQVLAQLNGTAPAEIKPPVGLCTTGDGAPSDDAAIPQAAASEPTDDSPGLTGIVTARQVEAISGKTLRLDYKAKLTALAADLVRDRGITIERVFGQASKGPTAGYIWWMDGKCPAVPGIVNQHGSQLTASNARDLKSAVRDMAMAVQAGRASGGVLFVPGAAKAGCYANRCAALRAAVATCEQAVAQAIEEVAANVLIVEYPYHNGDRMAAMVGKFLATGGKPDAMVERELKELSSCG